MRCARRRRAGQRGGATGLWHRIEGRGTASPAVALAGAIALTAPPPALSAPESAAAADGTVIAFCRPAADSDVANACLCSVQDVETLLDATQEEAHLLELWRRGALSRGELAEFARQRAAACALPAPDRTRRSGTGTGTGDVAVAAPSGIGPAASASRRGWRTARSEPGGAEPGGRGRP